MHARFEDRYEAGRELAARLTHLAGSDVIVLALPRGGVPVGYEIARALHAPLDILNVRKLGVPWQEELAMGAIGADGVRVLNGDVLHGARVARDELDAVIRREQLELERREIAYRDGRPMPSLRDRTVILVDDGIATGATVRAAVALVTAQRPAKLVVATPVAAAAVVEELQHEVDEVVCVAEPVDLFAIGAWYERFGQLDDGQVRALLSNASELRPLVHAPQ